MNNSVIAVSGLWPTEDQNGLKFLVSQALKPTDNKFLYFYTQDLVSLIRARDSDIIDLIGYSFGCQALYNALLNLPTNFKVRSCTFLDPVHYWWWGSDFKIPTNVSKSFCLKKSFGFPPSVGITTGVTKTINTWDHANFPRHPEVVRSTLQFLNNL